MLTQEEVVAISASLKKRSTVSAMARHMGRGRKTVVLNPVSTAQRWRDLWG
jgi:hypothetical protein